MPDAKRALTKKIGPFSIWVWVAALGGLAVVYVIYRRHSSSQMSSEVGIISGGQLAPLAATTGSPASNSAPAASLDPTVLAQIEGDISGLTSQFGVLAAESDYNSGQLTDIQTSLIGQAGKLDQLSSMVATSTLTGSTPSPVFGNYQGLVANPAVQSHFKSVAPPSKQVTKKKTLPAAKKKVKATGKTAAKKKK